MSDPDTFWDGEGHRGSTKQSKETKSLRRVGTKRKGRGDVRESHENPNSKTFLRSSETTGVKKTVCGGYPVVRISVRNDLTRPPVLL